MPRIKTRAALTEYLLRQLGNESITVHLSTASISDCIDRAIEKYSEYAWGGQIEGTLAVTLTPGVFKYTLADSISAVTGLAVTSMYQSFSNIPTGYGLQLDPISMSSIQSMETFNIQSSLNALSTISMIQYYFNVTPRYTYNPNSKELIFQEEVLGNIAVLGIAMDYEPNEAGDNIFNNFWIKKRALAECFFAWSNIVGLYDRELVGGARINYGDLQAKGERLMQETEEEIFEISTPLLPSVG